LVKAFNDPALEGKIAQMGARIITCPSVALGAKLAVGIETTDAELICFLEDDDCFSAGKLVEVWSRFRDPSLGYYHNSQCLIDESGAALPGSTFRGSARRRIHRLGAIYLPGDRSRSTLDVLAGIHPEFNTSSISVRRQILTDRLSVLRQIEVAADEFLFYCALGSRTALLVDSAPLSAFRIHSRNMSVGRKSNAVEESGRLSDYSSKIIADLTLLREMLLREHATEILPLVETNIAVQTIIQMLRAGGRDRSTLRDSVAFVGAHRSNFEARTFWPVRPLGRLYRIFPRVARWIYGIVGPGTR
jgi:hypothetical protein